MRFLSDLLKAKERHFKKGGRLEKLYPLYEATDSFLFKTAKPTEGAVHVRDGVDLKRVMITVVIALMPTVAMAIYNTGYQTNLAIAEGAKPLADWEHAVLGWLGAGYSPESIFDCAILGALYFLPILLVTFVVGGAWEVLFAVVRRHDINEGFLVTGMIFPLILPATTPLWQVALAISFGVVIGKEVFGGTGYNILNPALTARAFLFFGYPAQITGDQVWIPFDTSIPVDTVSGATPLAEAAVDGMAGLTSSDWWNAFWGFIPGSMGETSTLACIIGAAVLLITGVASYRIMLSVVLGTIAMATLLNLIGSDTNPLFAVPFWWHFVIGGLAFATVYIATEPVTAPHTQKGHWVYGFLIGVMIVVVRVLNPAYPDGILVGILLLNLFSPLIDHFVVGAHIKKRRARYGT
jgi:Na+-transporting NADH:ubiquinone oxidoreductase subunit B